eukprot:15361060-Ditylum_brightwellii.AAC.1
MALQQNAQAQVGAPHQPAQQRAQAQHQEQLRFSSRLRLSNNLSMYPLLGWKYAVLKQGIMEISDMDMIGPTLEDVR